MSKSATPIRDFIESKLVSQIGEGKRYHDNDHYGDVFFHMIDRYKEDSFEHYFKEPDGYGLTFRQMTIYAGLMGLTKEEFTTFQNLVKQEGKWLNAMPILEGAPDDPSLPADERVTMTRERLVKETDETIKHYRTPEFRGQAVPGWTVPLEATHTAAKLFPQPETPPAETPAPATLGAIPQKAAVAAAAVAAVATAEPKNKTPAKPPAEKPHQASRRSPAASKAQETQDTPRKPAPPTKQEIEIAKLLAKHQEAERKQRIEAAAKEKEAIIKLKQAAEEKVRERAAEEAKKRQDAEKAEEGRKAKEAEEKAAAEKAKADAKAKKEAERTRKREEAANRKQAAEERKRLAEEAKRQREDNKADQRLRQELKHRNSLKGGGAQTQKDEKARIEATKAARDERERIKRMRGTTRSSVNLWVERARKAAEHMPAHERIPLKEDGSTLSGNALLHHAQEQKLTFGQLLGRLQRQSGMTQERYAQTLGLDGFRLAKLKQDAQKRFLIPDMDALAEKLGAAQDETLTEAQKEKERVAWRRFMLGVPAEITPDSIAALLPDTEKKPPADAPAQGAQRHQILKAMLTTLMQLHGIPSMVQLGQYVAEQTGHAEMAEKIHDAVGRLFSGLSASTSPENAQFLAQFAFPDDSARQQTFMNYLTSGQNISTDPPDRTPARRAPRRSPSPHNNPSPGISREEFAASFDALFDTAMEHKPYGEGRTWLLTKFVDQLKKYKGFSGQKALAEAVSSEAGETYAQQLTIALNNAIDNRLLEKEALDTETMNNANTKRAGIANESMAGAIARYAFPDDEARQEKCRTFLDPKHFLIPEEVESQRKSEAMKRVRGERGDSWGKRVSRSRQGQDTQRA